MNRAVLALVVLAALPAWAGEPGEPLGVYKAYPGPERPDSELATLPKAEREDKVWKDWVSIRKTDPSGKDLGGVRASSYEQVKLLPGERHVSWGYATGKGERYYEVCARETVTLKAGHVYLLGASTRLDGALPPARTGMWIEDTTTHEIIAGRKPSEFLEPGQVNPPVTFRWLYDHPVSGPPTNEKSLFLHECTGEVSKDPEVLKRREMIIELGDQLLASPIRESGQLGRELTQIATNCEELRDEVCAGTLKTSRACKNIRKHVQHFVSRVEKKAEKGKLSDEDAAVLISKAQSLLLSIEGGK